MCFNVTSESEFHILSTTKVSAAKDHSQNYMKVRAPLVHHLLRNCLFVDDWPDGRKKKY